MSVGQKFKWGRSPLMERQGGLRGGGNKETRNRTKRPAQRGNKETRASELSSVTGHSSCSKTA
eukprot:scaffold69289_cov112-Cyclotella_meneghiniana.AAC.5